MYVLPSPINTLWVKKDATLHSCLTVAYVDRFSQFFHCWIQQEFAIRNSSCFQPCLTYVVTLPCEIKKSLLPFSHYSCYKNIHRNSLSFLVSVIHIIWHISLQHGYCICHHVSGFSFTNGVRGHGPSVVDR